MEKAQFGTQVEFQCLEKLIDMQTKHSHVEMFKTPCHGDVLMMDKEVQFSTLDEYRYHEILVHPAMSVLPIANADILILGGGDGLAAREVFKWDSIKSVTIVDYDDEFVAYSRTALDSLNHGALHRAKHVSMDAVQFCRTTKDTYDAIFIDLPDPDGDMLKVYKDCLEACRPLVRHCGSITLHTGAVSLDPAAPCWDILHSFAKQLNEMHYKVAFRSIFVPSFMNQWGFLTATTTCLPCRQLNGYAKLWRQGLAYDSDYARLFYEAVE
jgi:spermidine synthase